MQASQYNTSIVERSVSNVKLSTCLKNSPANTIVKHE
ncbi:Uncharacterised protein [Vibrio cholerae]|nr:Uncharacterised protein [Vibrio cholerae]